MSALRSAVENILALKTEQDALDAKIRESYGRAQKAGLDKTALGQVVTKYRKWGVDPRGYEGQHAKTQEYLQALDDEGYQPPTREGLTREGAPANMRMGATKLQ